MGKYIYILFISKCTYLSEDYLRKTF